MRRTQAERVVVTYKELVKKYPTPEDLLQANVQELREVFRPLGLTKRADVLIEAARKIVSEYGGQIPSNLNEVSKLPGMGIYGSRAVMCLAFDDPVPMIDESSGRLLRRVFSLEGRTSAYSDKHLLQTTTSMIPVKWAREFNMGLLDIASAFCHPDIPDCLPCPLRKVCLHYHETDQGSITTAT